MYYFAYGSNLSLARIRERVPSAKPLGCHALKGHDLRFHKAGRDDSAKCDAYFTSQYSDIIYGALYNIDPEQKPALDRAEGLGNGYELKEITVLASDGSPFKATTYVATNINKSLKPYSWYVNHVLIGANEAALPRDYVQRKIETVESIEDVDKKRDAKERAIHNTLK